MSRLRYILANEVKLARTTVPLHLVTILQPTVLFLLMSLILVHPTFELQVLAPETSEAQALVDAMRQVGSPIGLPYIEPLLIQDAEQADPRQLVAVEDRAGTPTAVQHFGLIDSNLVKNLRNRLTAATLRIWNEALNGRAVSIEEHPWLPVDPPYNAYFGMALLPLATFIAASVLGAAFTAQDFEFGTLLEYRLAPTSSALILFARMLRLVLSGLLSATLLSLAAGLTTRWWPGQWGQLALVLTLVALIAAGFGTAIGLLLRRSIPSFVLCLITTLGGWIFGSGFGLAASFGGAFEAVSRFTPNAHAVDLLFPCFYGIQTGMPLLSWMVLLAQAVLLLSLAAMLYQVRVRRRA